MGRELREKGKAQPAVVGRGAARKGRVLCRRCVPRRLFSQMLREGVDHATHFNALAKDCEENTFNAQIVKTSTIINSAQNYKVTLGRVCLDQNG